MYLAVDPLAKARPVKVGSSLLDWSFLGELGQPLVGRCDLLQRLLGGGVAELFGHATRIIRSLPPISGVVDCAWRFHVW
jgi:hypothetical protein